MQTDRYRDTDRQTDGRTDRDRQTETDRRTENEKERFYWGTGTTTIGLGKRMGSGDRKVDDFLHNELLLNCFCVCFLR